MSIQIQKLVGFDSYVRDLESVRRFYVERLGFAEVARSSAELERASRQRSYVFRAGKAFITCTSPLGTDAPAARYLSKHPDGVGSLTFEVDDIRNVFAKLELNGATPTSDIEIFEESQGSSASFSITTPLGDTTFRFIERRGQPGLFPGMQTYDIPRGAASEHGFAEIDHVTANLRTMRPTLLWLEHVLEFQPLWGVEFHTAGTGQQAPGGSGLRSQVMWDPASGVKLASNEPLRPSFESSQIAVFCDDNGGDGIQHVALAVPDILQTVRALRARDVQLMPAPPGYYSRLPEHLRQLGIDAIDEDLATLEELGILVDGSGPQAYLLQIFLKDSAGIFGNAEAGPFFFEVIQRKGDAGFGAGNFRALFDSVAEQQVARTG